MEDGSRVVFIVGFERCLTSSLAAYLLEGKYCLPLVNGIKEPKVFSSDPELATAILRRRTRQTASWLLDGSVTYVTNAKALAAIRETVEDARIIVCLRNQFHRTASAYQLYRGVFARLISSVDWNSWPFTLEFGNDVIRAAAEHDPLGLPKLKQRPRGRYVYSAMAAFAGCPHAFDAKVLEDHDSAVEEFQTTSLPTRVISELRYVRRTGKFPLMSVLLNSYFSGWIQQLLAIFDDRQILFATLQDGGVQERLHTTLGSFLGVVGRDSSLPRVLDSEQFGALVSKHDRQLAEQVLRPSLMEDSRKLLAVLKSHPDLDLSLFAPDELY